MRQQDGVLVEQLSQSTGYSRLFCAVCINRGLTDRAAIDEYVRASIVQFTAHDLYGIPKAVERIIRAIEGAEKIVIYGDYDVDGITSTALLVKVLRDLGCAEQRVEYYIPERQAEGYGLNEDALLHIMDKLQATLVITVDCGISGYAEVEAVRERLDIIITDHHQPPSNIPRAYAVINPRLTECCYECESLAGVGVALKLAQALCAYYHSSCWEDYLDIAAIGTIADMVPLTGENRAIVKAGLHLLNCTNNTGLKALMEVSGLVGNAVSTETVGYALAPRLNAAGRLSHATFSVDLFLEQDYARALAIAQQLNEANIARQQYEKDIFLRADEYLHDSGHAYDNVIVLAGDWHSGVIGIVASRLVSKYYRPVVMISLKDGVGKGSCRSIHSFNIHAALAQCSDLLLGFGGHFFAAGLTVDERNIDVLRERLNDIAERTLAARDYLPVLELDAEISSRDIKAALLNELNLLEPFGIGNARPLFALRHISTRSKGVSWRKIGADKRHLKMTIPGYQDAPVEALCWDMADVVEVLEYTREFSLAVGLDKNVWRDVERLQLKVSSLSIEESLIDRNMLVELYSALKKRNAVGGLIMVNEAFLSDIDCGRSVFSLMALHTGLQVFCEIGLLDFQRGASGFEVTLHVEPNAKLNLNQSPTYVFWSHQKELLATNNGMGYN